MSENSNRKPLPSQILPFTGLCLGWLVFLCGLFIGMSIDPRVDMVSRLQAYTVALGGLSAAFACRWVLAVAAFERKCYAGITIAAIACFVGYGIVML